MKTVMIEIPSNIYTRILTHLLPEKMESEEAAFVFAVNTEINGELTFQYRSHLLAEEADFDFKSDWHIELSDEFRARLIKQAHDLGCSVIEFHSHLDQPTARFSASDWSGFSEFVPHIFWRLGGKPYAAVVVTKDSFDAIAWQEATKVIAVKGIRTGEHIYKPTGSSLKQHFYGT